MRTVHLRRNSQETDLLTELQVIQVFQKKKFPASTNGRAKYCSLKQGISASSMCNRNGEQEQKKPAIFVYYLHLNIAEQLQTTDMRLKVTYV